MGLLDANSDALQSAALNTWGTKPQPESPGIFSNFGSTAGNYFMRGFAEAGRAASMLGSVVPIAADWAIDPETPVGRALDIKDKPLQDRYFAWHDAFFGRAVDYWTLRPEEVGAAGQVVGQVGSGLIKFLASAPLSVAEAQMTSGEDMVRQGVDAGTAQVVGAIQGASQAVGIRMPAAFGNTLVQRIATGAGLNVLQNAVATEAQRLALKAGGAPDNVVQQFDPLDAKGRTVDALMGAVFGAKAHIDASAIERDALMALAQARHVEESSLPGRPATVADMTAAVNGTHQAMEQMLRGEPVAVDSPLPDFRPDPQAEAYRSEFGKIAEDEGVVKPIEPPKMIEPTPQEPEAGGKPKPAEVRFDESLRLPTGEFDAQGNERTVSANDHIAAAKADAERVKTTAAGFLRTAAECLLGSI